jgi:hypothetical protein
LWNGCYTCVEGDHTLLSGSDSDGVIIVMDSQDDSMRVSGKARSRILVCVSDVPKCFRSASYEESSPLYPFQPPHLGSDISSASYKYHNLSIIIPLFISYRWDLSFLLSSTLSPTRHTPPVHKLQTSTLPYPVASTPSRTHLQTQSHPPKRFTIQVHHTSMLELLRPLASIDQSSLVYMASHLMSSFSPYAPPITAAAPVSEGNEIKSPQAQAANLAVFALRAFLIGCAISWIKWGYYYTIDKIEHCKFPTSVSVFS